MTAFDLIVNLVVLVPFVYVCVVTVIGWAGALRRGEAVTLLPQRPGRAWPAWMPIVLIGVGLVLFVALIPLLWIPLPVVVPAQLKPLVTVIGLALYLGGLGVTWWARRTLGANWGLSTSREVKLRAEHELIQGGPYAYVRHPMYAGWFLALIGLILVYANWFVVAMFVFSLMSFLSRARKEEAALAERFGDAWVRYKARTKAMIPFVV